MARRTVWLALAASIIGCATPAGNGGGAARCATCGGPVGEAHAAAAPANPKAACCHKTAGPAFCAACAAK